METFPREEAWESIGSEACYKIRTVYHGKSDETKHNGLCRIDAGSFTFYAFKAFSTKVRSGVA